MASTGQLGFMTHEDHRLLIFVAPSQVPIKYTTQQQLLTDLDLESPSHNPFKQVRVTLHPRVRV